MSQTKPSAKRLSNKDLPGNAHEDFMDTQWMGCMDIQCCQENQRQVRCIKTFEDGIRKDIVLSKGLFRMRMIRLMAFTENTFGLKNEHRKHSVAETFLNMTKQYKEHYINVINKRFMSVLIHGKSVSNEALLKCFLPALLPKVADVSVFVCYFRVLEDLERKKYNNVCKVTQPVALGKEPSRKPTH